MELTPQRIQQLTKLYEKLDASIVAGGNPTHFKYVELKKAADDLDCSFPTSSDFKKMDLDDLISLFRSMPFPGVEPIQEEDDVEETPDHSSEVSDAYNQYLAATRYRLNPTPGSFLDKFCAFVGQDFKHLSLGALQEEMSKVFNVTSNFSHDLVAGPDTMITMKLYNEWAQAQTGTTFVCGPLSFWNILERVGLTCTIIETRPGSNRYALRYTKGKSSLIMWDRYMIHSNWAEDTEATVDEVSAFLGDMKFRGKYITYRPIKHEAYRIAFAFLATYKLKLSKDETGMTCSLLSTPTRGSKFKLATLGDVTSEIMEMVKNAINAKKIRGPDAISAMENIARWIETNVAKAQLVEAIDEVEAGVESAYEYIEMLKGDLDNISRCGVEKRCKLLEQKASCKGTVESALQCLKDAREVRNAADTGALVNHGVASVSSSNMPEWVDTYTKGAMITNYLLAEGPTITKDTKIFVYGVALGHMIPVLNRLRCPDTEHTNITYVDNKKATGSTETFVLGDVFSHETMGAWIIDDTDSHSLRSDLAQKNKGYTGDHYKIQQFILTASPVIVSKLRLKSFRTQDQMELWDTILYTDTSEYTWQLVKFGRLHNEECFMIGMRENTGDNINNLMGDLKTVAYSVEVANEIIMQWQGVGQRAGSVRASRGEKVTLGSIWKSVIAALPVDWGWYLEYDPLEHELTSMADLEETMANEKVTFRKKTITTIHSLPKTLDMKIHDLPKMPSVTYKDGVSLKVGPTTRLGYGCHPELQAQIVTRGVIQVKWEGDEHGKWVASETTTELKEVKRPTNKPAPPKLAKKTVVVDKKKKSKAQ